MMDRRSVLKLTLAAPLLCLFGCKKAAKTEAAPINLKGAPEVLAALNRKEYDAAIRGLLEIKSALTDDQRPEYSKLLRKVKDVMLDRMATDEAAAKAYQGLRFIEAGR
ncbi:MAG: hypothetical protein FJ398_26470 [Verrucomicrobia bacterium]|nr:hypothetical protein [Verrucomicrobiota bacterium]